MFLMTTATAPTGRSDMKNELDAIQADLNRNLGRLTLITLFISGGYVITLSLI